MPGLRRGDFNRDGNLDWLTVGHGFSRADDEEILIKKGLKINKLACENSQCYKITAVTFSQGQWSPLMDAQKQEYYFLVRLAEPLDPDSGFTILAYRWPDYFFCLIIRYLHDIRNQALIDFEAIT